MSNHVHSDALDAAGARLSGGGVLPVAGDEGAPAPAGDALTRSHLEERLEEQRKTQEELHRQQMAELEGRLTADAARGRVIAGLDGFLRGGVGTDEAERELQVGIYRLKDRVWQGELGKEVEVRDDKGHASKVVQDEAWFMGRAEALHKGIVERVLSEGGMGEGGLPGIKPAADLSDKAGHKHFDANRLLEGLRKEFGTDIQQLRSLTQLTGSPEAEWCQAQAKESDLAREMLAKAGGQGVKIPVPADAFGGAVRRAYIDERLAEEYSEAGMTTTPDYRRDLLVNVFRPFNNLSTLGVGRVTVDNNITVPVVTAGNSASWRTEKQAVADSGLTIAVRESAPKRAASLDELTWMLLASADKIGIQNLALMEMLRAVEELIERAVYRGDGTGGAPIGAWQTTGVRSFAKPTGDPTTYPQWLKIMDELTAQNIPIDMAAAVMTWEAKRTFQTIFTATNNGYPLFRSARTPGGGDMSLGLNRFPAGRGYWLDFDAVATTQMPGTVHATNFAQTGGTDDGILWAVWMYTILVRYRMAVLTVDNITKADTAQTRLVYNEFCDVMKRVPGSIVRSQITPAA